MNNDEEESLKKLDPVYEEIFDPTKAKKKLEFQNDTMSSGYENVQEGQGGKGKVVNGIHSYRPVTPSAPLEEDFSNTARPSAVPNEYSIFQGSSMTKATEIQRSACSKPLEEQPDDTELLEEFGKPPVAANTYSDFDDLIPLKQAGILDTDKRQMLSLCDDKGESGSLDVVATCQSSKEILECEETVSPTVLERTNEHVCTNNDVVGEKNNSIATTDEQIDAENGHVGAMTDESDKTVDKMCTCEVKHEQKELETDQLSMDSTHIEEINEHIADCSDLSKSELQCGGEIRM